MIRIFKPTIFVLCLVPFIVIAYQILFNQLGAEPVKQVTHHTGEWTLRFILLSLAMTPLKNITKILAWIKYRRMLGLFAFFYGTLHLLTYIGLDYQFNLDLIIDDVLNKKFIFIGFSWSFSYHLLNGIRHMFWDMGYGYDLKVANLSGIIVLILSFILTFLAWII